MKNHDYIKTKKGFTLIELLMVMAIIGILASVVLVNLNSARERAKNAKALSTMQSVFNIAQMCFWEGSALNIPPSGYNPGTAICAAESQTLPDLTSTGFQYCGNPCGGWTSNSNGFAISIQKDSGVVNIVCGTNVNVGTWYTGTGVPSGYYNFTGISTCKAYGF